MKLLYNGKIYSSNRYYEAMVIDGEVIKTLGKTEDLINKYYYQQKIDLNGWLVLPGFNDAHMHIIDYAKNKLRINIDYICMLDDFLKLGKQSLQSESKLLIFIKYLEAEDFSLSIHDLDEISTAIPIIVYRVCGHKAIVNSKVFEILNLEDHSTFGILTENELSILKTLEDELSIEELESLIEATVEEANRLGITSIGTNDVIHDLNFGKKVVQAYSNLLEKQKLNTRINLQFSLMDETEILDFLKLKVANNYFKIGPLKLFSDGSLGAKTAYLSKPYKNNSTNGLLTITKEKLTSLIQFAKLHNLQVLVHSIGDAASNFCLDIFEELQSLEQEKNNLRHALIHVQITDEALLNRFEELKINTIVQPIFISEDIPLLKNRIEEDMATASYAFNSLFQKTITAFSSDAPYGGFNVINGIFASCTRKNLETSEMMNLHEKMKIRDVIKAYTENPAYLTFEETMKGKIESGYLADFVVLDQDILNLDNFEGIKKTKIIMTIVGGRIVYDGRNEKNQGSKNLHCGRRNC